MIDRCFVVPLLLSSLIASISCFVSQPKWGIGASSSFQKKLYLFDKLFEEEGPLGKGITVGKVQVALMSSDRGPGSIFRMLQDNARWTDGDDESSSLADLAHEVCLTLLRKKDDWTAACSDSQWFSGNDSGKAEALYNEWANTEAAKFEKVGVHRFAAGDVSGTVYSISLHWWISNTFQKFPTRTRVGQPL
jgi:Protein of unknown function (DUF1517)